MRWRVHAAWLSFLLLSTSWAILCAQQQPAKPAAPKDDPVRVLPSDSASKSVEIGDFYLRRRKYQAALSRFQDALKTDPHYAPAYRELGRVYEKMGQWKKSLDAYQKYLDELPSAKDAREAKEIHKAIARMQKEIVAEGNSSHGAR
ncbi:MAG: tetratricopeptide repeat protein [Terriglobia bacterium]|jgi:tetratricopeptide (TPR) repeat protein